MAHGARGRDLGVPGPRAVKQQRDDPPPCLYNRGMVESAVLRVWRSGDTDTLAALLADDAAFSSPAADYAGRRDVSHMLGLIARVLQDVHAGSRWGDENEAVSSFTARFQGEEMQGMLREQRDSSGALAHVTLYLRPYRVLRAAMARIADLLACSPLPGGAGRPHAGSGG